MSDNPHDANETAPASEPVPCEAWNELRDAALSVVDYWQKGGYVEGQEARLTAAARNPILSEITPFDGEYVFDYYIKNGRKLWSWSREGRMRHGFKTRSLAVESAQRDIQKREGNDEQGQYRRRPVHRGRFFA